METNHSSSLHEEFVGSIYGLGASLGVVIVADGERSGDHCRYTVRLESSDAAFDSGDVAAFSFSGELERDVVADALRWAADRLDAFGRSD